MVFNVVFNCILVVQLRKRKNIKTANFLYLTLFQTTHLDSSKLKAFADDNFNFDEKDRKFSKRVENNVEKQEIARYEQFLLFPRCFQKTCTADT